MNIYEIDSQILSCIDEETGEILDVERLEKLIQDKNNKIESVACWYKNTVAPTAYILLISILAIFSLYLYIALSQYNGPFLP